MTSSKFFDTEAESLYRSLCSVEPKVTKQYNKYGIWGKRMRASYGTEELFNLITDPKSKYFKDYQLVWFYFNNYGVNFWELKKKFSNYKEIDPVFKIPLNWRRGLNDCVCKYDRKIKSVSMNGPLMYQPSIEHIVQQSRGGPVDDIRNMMILPLEYNMALRNMDDRARECFLKGIQSSEFQKQRKEAVRLFGKNRS